MKAPKKVRAAGAASEAQTVHRPLLKRSVRKLARRALETVSSVRPRHWDALWISLSQARPFAVASTPAPVHLRAVMGWLKAAQDATRSGGISWGYRARATVRSGETVGWQPAYPETTGYLIETFLRYGRLAQDADSFNRARRMADWETAIQLGDGGIQGGTLGVQPASSSTFVTGQVIFGWLSAFEEWKEQKYADAACRAADFLLSCLDESGRFRTGYSNFCEPGPKAYEVRTGWALALAGQKLNVPSYVNAARSIMEFTLSCQKPNGWFTQNDLDRHATPLTHTIGYTLEGLLQLGPLLDESRCLEAVNKTLSRIRSLTCEDGYLSGRWTANWEPAASWCCLTGSCQLASVCFRAHRLYPNLGFDQLGERLLGFVASTQLLQGTSRGLVGGIHGSYPFQGDYGRYCSLNWAAKFYADALMNFFAMKNRLGANSIGANLEQPVSA